MVAYSFQRMFADPILIGRKVHTVRAQRKRHARAGEQLQLYTGMRTKQCRLVARATCEKVAEIAFRFHGDRAQDAYYIDGERHGGPALDEFAYKDGFDSWLALRGFWRIHHEGPKWFDGVIIYWKDLVPG